MSARDWAQTLPGCFLATTCEFGYSLCGGVFSFAAARELGRNLLHAVQRTAAEAWRGEGGTVSATTIPPSSKDAAS